MTANELRQKYLEFFSAKGGSASGGESKGHAIIPSASLIPENDPSVLFTTAGMHPLVPFLMGEKHPAGKRLVSCQKCIRTGDIDEVGDNFHLTFFEMLGNWSLGDPAEPGGLGRASYWKKEAIEWSYEFLTEKKWLGLDKSKLAISVFSGDSDCPFDQESYNVWIKLGIKSERITKLGKDDNWWPAGGKYVGPQGPDTEMFYWTSSEPAPAKFDPSDKNWCEIWNNVFMEYECTTNGEYRPLKRKNVDTGMGLERTIAVLQGKASVYETELFESVMTYLKSVAQSYDERSARIIADHLRSAIMIMADDLGIFPSNLKQGYVVRKLVRRAIRHAKKIGIPPEINITAPIIEIVADGLKEIYPELLKNKQFVVEELNKEESGFEKTLENGIKFFRDKVSWAGLHSGEPTIFDSSSEAPEAKIDKLFSKINGKLFFDVYQTYGFPLEMSIEELNNSGYRVDVNVIKQWNQEFENEMKKHQELSRTASSGQFKGGLVSQSEMTIKYHTATHLLHQALRQILGNHVEQKGSNITDERLRFDFSHAEKMTAEQIKQAEDLVNQIIQKDLTVECCEMTVQDAKSAGAIGLFGNKYGDKVKVYTIGESPTGSRFPFSREICGGPHVIKTGLLGHFKIIKEEASSRGVRRIKAVLEKKPRHVCLGK